MNESGETLFTRIINRDVPAEFIYEDDKCVVINDIAPQAPIHMLVIPRKPLYRLSDASMGDVNLLGHLLWVAGEVARRRGIDNAFRLIINNGAEAGQTIFHLHLHVLGRQSFDHADLSSI